MIANPGSLSIIGFYEELSLADSPRYRIIDTHQHVFWQGRDDTAHIEDMDAHQIDLAWILTSEAPDYQAQPATRGAFALNPLHMSPDGMHPGLVFSDLLKARQNYPGRYLLGYCPDPMLPAAADLFEAAVAMYDVRICGEWKFRLPFDDPRCLELFKAAGRAGAPVVLHLDVPYLPDEQGLPIYQPHWFGGTIENLERALIACPQTNFIGHAPGFWREISGDAAREPRQYPKGPIVPGGRLHGLFEKYPNLFADLSANSGLTAIKRDPAQGMEFLTRFADRLLFGRDNYGGDLLEYLKTLSLPAKVAAAIFRENAIRLVNPDQSRSRA